MKGNGRVPGGGPLPLKGNGPSPVAFERQRLGSRVNSYSVAVARAGSPGSCVMLCVSMVFFGVLLLYFARG